MNSRRITRTDYTNFSPAPPIAAPEPPADAAAEEQMTISIRIAYPDFSQWRIYQFARQFPFLTIVICIAVFFALVLGADGLSWLSHDLHKMFARQNTGVIKLWI